jgi:large conductance mechanosensitive channel
MIKEFREFLLRGNVVDLAVAVILGAAFGAVITSFVEDLLTPLLAAVGGEPDFAGLTFTINRSAFRYGEFINAIISFLIIGAAVFLLVVKPVNALMARRKADLEPEPASEAATSREARGSVPEDVVLLGEIRDLLKAGSR